MDQDFSFEYFQLNTSDSPSPQITESDEKYFKDANNFYHCVFPACGKIFKFKSDITRHNVIHYTKRPFVCPFEDCKKDFKRSDALTAHLLLHNNDLPFNCDFPGCKEKFTTKPSLKYHILKHKNDRIFVCSFPGCQKSFVTKGQLTQHQRSYTYHINLSKMQQEISEMATPISNHSYSENEYCRETYPSTPSFIQSLDSACTDCTEEARTEGDRESFESIVKYVLTEKNPVKNQQYYEDNNKPSFPVNTKQKCRQAKRQGVFMDENELQLINFLKEQRN